MGGKWLLLNVLECYHVLFTFFCQYKMTATFVEIYNETLHNLLATGKKEEKHEIRIDPKNQGEVYVTNLTPVVITSEKQVHNIYTYKLAFLYCNVFGGRSK